MGVAVALYEEVGALSAADSEEARLLRRCRAGDRHAQEALVRLCQDRVYRLAYSLLGHREEALDAAQEALVAMLRSLRSFRGEARFQTWLYRLVTNVCLMRRRSHQARTRLLVDAPASGLEFPDERPDPEAVALRGEAQTAVRECLLRLPADFRAVVVLRELEGLSYEEIAETLAIPLGTVQSRLSRGRELLRRALLADTRVPLPRSKGEV